MRKYLIFFMRDRALIRPEDQFSPGHADQWNADTAKGYLCIPWVAPNGASIINEPLVESMFKDKDIDIYPGEV
jgi:hypothetical protein